METSSESLGQKGKAAGSSSHTVLSAQSHSLVWEKDRKTRQPRRSLNFPGRVTRLRQLAQDIHVIRASEGETATLQVPLSLLKTSGEAASPWHLSQVLLR